MGAALRDVLELVLARLWGRELFLGSGGGSAGSGEFYCIF